MGGGGGFDAERAVPAGVVPGALLYEPEGVQVGVCTHRSGVCGGGEGGPGVWEG